MNLSLRDTDLASLVNSGKTWAMCKLANRLEYRDPEEARHLYLRAGLLGEVSAYSRLGRMYFFGRGGVRNREEARRWFERAYLEPESAYFLGLMAHRKFGGEEARLWWTLSARGGMPEAMFRLGSLLEEMGEFKEARKWYTRASEDQERACFPLAKMLLEGKGGAVDPLGARFFFQKGAESGDTKSMVYLGRMMGKKGRGWLKKAFKGGRKNALLLI